MTAGSIREQLLREARNCALAMMDAAEFLGGTLSHVHVDEPARSQLTALLPDLDMTGRDLFGAVSLLRSPRSASMRRIDQHDLIGRSLDAVADVMLKLNRVVISLTGLAGRDTARGEAFVLIAESTMTILAPFERARESATTLFGTPKA